MSDDDDIFAAIDRAALKQRGSLRAWMLKNQVALAERLRIQKPHWPTLAKVLADAGLLDARGKAPTAEATRKTWYRVQADLAESPVAAVRSPPVQAAPVPVGSVRVDPPRTRKPITLRPPRPLAEGEAAPDDGSQLPKPLRPERS